jgi:hypothetical protein
VYDRERDASLKPVEISSGHVIRTATARTTYSKTALIRT